MIRERLVAGTFAEHQEDGTIILTQADYGLDMSIESNKIVLSLEIQQKLIEFIASFAKPISEIRKEIENLLAEGVGNVIN